MNSTQLNPIYLIKHLGCENQMIIYQNIEKIKNLEHKRILDQMRIKGRLPKKKRIRNKIKKQNEKNNIQFLDEYHHLGKN